MRANWLTRLGLVGVILGVVGCSTTRVSLDYDRGVDFSRYKTYAWLPQPIPRPDLSEADNDLVDARMRESVNRELALKGYVPAPEGQADFLVTYDTTVEEKMSVQPVTYNYHPVPYLYTHRHGSRHVHWVEPYYAGYWPYTDYYVNYYKERTVILNIVDRATRKLIWRGTLVRVVREKTPEEIDREISKIVSRLLKNYPPAPLPRPTVQLSAASVEK